MIGKLFLKDARLRPLWRVIVYSIAVVFTAEMLFDVFAVIAGRRFEGLITFEFAAAIAVLIVSIFLRRQLDHRSVESLGFAPRGPWLRLFGVGILFGAGMQTVTNVILWVSGSSRLTGHSGFASDVRLITTAAALLLAAAFLEEMSFRGYILQNLWEEWGLWPAIVLSSIGFAALHGSNPHSHEHLVLTVAGLVAFALWACMSLIWTKSLWLALGAHAAWNLFEGPVLGLPVSGELTPVPTVISQSVNGPVWLTGGSFGPEAGTSSLVALALGFVVLRVLHAKGAFADAVDTSEEYAKK